MNTGKTHLRNADVMTVENVYILAEIFPKTML